MTSAPRLVRYSRGWCRWRSPSHGLQDDAGQVTANSRRIASSDPRRAVAQPRVPNGRGPESQDPGASRCWRDSAAALQRRPWNSIPTISTSGKPRGSSTTAGRSPNPRPVTTSARSSSGFGIRRRSIGAAGWLSSAVRSSPPPPHRSQAGAQRLGLAQHFAGGRQQLGR